MENTNQNDPQYQNLTPTLTPAQIRENLDTLSAAGKSVGDRQAYANLYQGGPDGNYHLKGPTSSIPPKPFQPEESHTAVGEFITGGKAGQDIAQAGYMGFQYLKGALGGKNAVEDTRQQYVDNGNRLLDLANKQKDAATKLKYSKMAAQMYTESGNVPEGIIGKVRTGEQVTGDMIGLLTNLAMGGGAVSGLGKVSTAIENPIVKAGVEGAIHGATQGGAFGTGQGLAQGLQKKGNALQVAGSTLAGGAIGAATGAAAGGALGAGGEVYNNITAPGAQTPEQLAIQKATEDVTPHYNAKKMPAGENIYGKQGELLGPRVNESVGFGQRTVNSNPMEGQAGEAIAGLGEGYPTKGTYLQKAQAVKTAITDEAQSIRSAISKETAVIPREQTKLLVENAINDAAGNSITLERTDPLVNKYLDIVNKAIDNNIETAEGVLDTRQEMDKAYKLAKGNLAFSDEKVKLLDEVHTAARNELNQNLIENVQDADVKASLKKQFDLYRAYDVLNQKAAVEGTSKVSRLLKKIPGGKKTVIGVAAALGLEGVTHNASKVIK